MALTLGASSAASFRNMQYLNQTKSLMDKSLQRISSGKRILSAGDDPGGLAFSMRLQNELTINNTVQSNVENGKSFLEVQDGALKTAGDLLSQMITLKDDYGTTSDNSTKEVYARQFRDLQVQLGQLQGEKLNGVSLFNMDPTKAKVVYTSTQGTSGSKISLGMMDYNGAFGVSINVAGNLADATQAGTVVMTGASASNTGDALSISQVESTELTNISNKISGLRAQSGGKLSTLGFVSEYLGKKSATLESAHSRVMDADIAEESLNYSKYSLQYQAGAAALAQSNLSMQVVLDLLKFPSIRS